MVEKGFQCASGGLDFTGWPEGITGVSQIGH